MDVEASKKQLDNDLKQNYAKVAYEYHYNTIKGKIICEEYINDKTGRFPTDYKIFCFNGKPECILVLTGRESGVKRYCYDVNWNFLQYIRNDKQKNSLKLEKPVNFDKMLEIAANLSKPFPFVRVDLYNAGGKIYFGELTFTPSAGVHKSFTQEALDHFGSLIDLKKY